MGNTYYSSLTGMLAASFGLQTTSHNVANMQSHGFKRSDVFYSSLGDEKNQAKPGSGVRISGTATNFNAGSYLETGKPYDLAIDGQGFFIIRQKNGELFYTLDGEFDFNPDGFLAERHSGGLVQGFDAKGNLVNIEKSAPQIHIGKASNIKEEGRLVSQTFDDNGQLSYNYDNNQTLPGPSIAIAKFVDPEHSLIQTSDNLFRAKTEVGRQIGRANQGGFGAIQPKKLESSNVDSTTEFANIVVLQRMFQACSQIMDIEKQLLDELYKR